MTKSKIVRVRWGLLRPGATVVSENETDHEHKVVTVEHQGSTVNVLFWDGVREHHREDAYPQVRLRDDMTAGTRTTWKLTRPSELASSAGFFPAT
jgi:prepilin-type processing-associated H-X9-DG protein